MFRDYSKKDVTPEQKTALENWAYTLCDACILKNPRSAESGKVSNVKRAVDFPSDLLDLLNRSKIKLRGYNFCSEHLAEFREEIKPLLTKK